MSRDDKPRRAFNVGDPIPQVLTKEELAAFTGYSVRQIDRFRKLRNHPAIEELPGPGQPRFKGRAVRAWLEGGEPKPATRTFFNRGGRA